MKLKLLRSGMLLLTGDVVGRLCTLAASMQVAWVVPQADFGVGASLWLISSLVRMLGDLGMEQLMIQSPDGDDDLFGRVANAMLLLRGAFVSVALFALAAPSAAMLQRPDLTWALCLIGLQPAIEGMKHTDVTRFQRQLHFTRVAVVNSLPQLVTAFAAYPLAVYFGDYRVFLALSFLRTALAVAVSHLLAERPYRLGWNKTIVGRFLNFGWPLVFNSLFIFAGMQGTQLIIACFYPSTQFATFSVAMMLTWMPVSLVDGIVQMLTLPTLASAHQHRSTFIRLVCALAISLGTLAAAVACFYVMLGRYAIDWLYGAKYQDAVTLVHILGVSQAVRLLRVSPTLAALASGNTSMTMFANASRLASLAICLLLAEQGAAIEQLCVAMIVIDALTVPTIIYLVRLVVKIPSIVFVPGIGVFIAALSLVAVVHFLIGPSELAAIASAIAIGAGLALVFYLTVWRQQSQCIGQSSP